MDALQDSPAIEPLPTLIALPQVWTHLALEQQHQLLQTLVAICQELLDLLASVPASEVRHD